MALYNFRIIIIIIIIIMSQSNYSSNLFVFLQQKLITVTNYFWK